MTEEANKIPESSVQSLEAESRTVVHHAFVDHLRVILPPIYNEPLIDIDDVSRSSVLNCLHRARFRELRTDERYEALTTFLNIFLTRNLHHVYVPLSKHFIRTRQDMVCTYGTVAVLSEKVLMRYLAAALYKRFQLKNGPLRLIFLSKCQFDLL